MYQPSDEPLVVIYRDWTFGEKYPGDNIEKTVLHYTLHY